MKFLSSQKNLLPVIQKSYDQFHQWVGKMYRLPVYWMNFQNKVFVKDTDLKLPIQCSGIFYGYLVIRRGKLLPPTNQSHLKQLRALLFNSMESDSIWNKMKLNTNRQTDIKKLQKNVPSRAFFVLAKDKRQRRQFALALHQSRKTLFLWPVKTLKDQGSISSHSLPFTVVFLEEVTHLSREEIQHLPSYLKQLQDQGASIVIGSKYPLPDLCKKYKISEKDLESLYKNTVEL